MPSPTLLDELIERVVREVIRRLEARGATEAKGIEVRTISLSERLITAASIESIPAGTSEIQIASRAVLTPLARDEARERGIRIIRQTQGSTT